MKSAVYTGSKTIVTEDREPLVLEQDRIHVKVMASGICGTDVHIYHGEAGSADVDPPVVLGHEFSGIVMAVGADVSHIKQGDHVTVDPNIYCGVCEYCRTGRKQLCESMEAVGVTMDGGFAEECSVPKDQVIKVADHVDYEEAAMSEPIACCIHGLDIVGIEAGDRVVVVGGGAIGLMMVQLAKINGASKVILSEPVEMRRGIAMEVGADDAVNPMESDLKTQLNACFNHEPINVVIECVGKEIAVKQAIEIADKGTRILLFSVPGIDAKVELPLFDVFKKELKIFGSFVNPDTQQRAVALLNSGKLKIKEIITHRYPLNQVDQAIVKQMENDSIKVIVKPNN